MPKPYITTHYHDLQDQRRRSHRNDRMAMLCVIVLVPTALALALHLTW